MAVTGARERYHPDGVPTLKVVLRGRHYDCFKEAPLEGVGRVSHTILLLSSYYILFIFVKISCKMCCWTENVIRG